MKRTFTRMLLLILCLTLVAGLAVSASAEDYTDHDTALDYLENYDSYVGSDADFAANIKQALETVRQTISQYAFSGCVSLSSLTLPDTLTSLGAYVFSRCEKLTTITLPQGCQAHRNAFSGCPQLTVEYK